MKPEYLFVYGTLLPNQASEVRDLVRQMQRVGPATVRGRLYDLGEYPGAIIDNNSTTLVHGEVYRLPSNIGVLTKLDNYEEFDPDSPESSLFLRIKCFVRLFDGRILECWIYTYNGDVETAPFIPSGKYAELKAS